LILREILKQTKSNDPNSRMEAALRQFKLLQKANFDKSLIQEDPELAEFRRAYSFMADQEGQT